MIFVIFIDDTPPLQTQEEQNDMLFDDFARLYSAQTDPKHLNAMRMVLTIAKFVFLNRYNQDVLASCFFDRTPAQAHELGEQVTKKKREKVNDELFMKTLFFYKHLFCLITALSFVLERGSKVPERIFGSFDGCVRDEPQ